MPRGDDIGGNAGVVERVDVVVADQQVAAAGPLLQLLELGPQPRVVSEEVMAGVPLALDQRVADEQLPRHHRLDACVSDAAARHQRQPVQRHPLVGQHLAALGVPMRFAVGALHQVAGDPLHDLRLDAGGGPAVQAAGLDQLGHDDPARRPFGERRTRCQHEVRVPGAQILTGVLTAHAHVRQQPREHRRVHQPRVGGLLGRGVFDDAQVAGDAAQLPDQILPFADAQIVQEFRTAHLTKRIAG